MTDRRKLPPIGSTKVVEGVTFTASVYLYDGRDEAYSPEDWIVWDGGNRGGRITEQSAKSVIGEAAFTGDRVTCKLPRFRLDNMRCGETFAPLARQSIERQRLAYLKAKAFVTEFEEIA